MNRPTGPEAQQLEDRVRRGVHKALVPGLLLVTLAPFLLFFEVIFGPTCGLVCSRPGMGGWGPAMDAALSGCPEAAKALGSPIRFHLFGPMRLDSNFRLGGGNGGYANDGYVNERYPVSGPLGDATYHFVAAEHGTTWTVGVAELELGGRKLDLLRCADAAASGASR